MYMCSGLSRPPCGKVAGRSSFLALVVHAFLGSLKLIKQILAHEQKNLMNIFQVKHMKAIPLFLSRDLNTAQDWQPAEATRWCINIANKYEMDEYD